MLTAAAACLAASPASAGAVDPNARFRATYRELVETDTTLSNGSCTLAARRMQARLTAAGYAPGRFETVIPPAFPKQGNLIGSVAGSDPGAPAILLLAHLDVPIERIAERMWPGVPVLPSLSSGATDGRFLLAAGVPTYGVSGLFVDPDGDGVHGLDERVRVQSLYDARAFLARLITAYADAR